MPSRDVKTLHPDMRVIAEKFLVQCLAEGINAFLTCCYRSSEEQDDLYSQGRSKPGKIVTNARGAQSPHNCVDSSGKPAARAFDFAIKTAEGSLDWSGDSGQWVRALDIGRSLGLISGADWKIKDYAHMELPSWRAVT